jgi:hypothetical protein
MMIRCEEMAPMPKGWNAPIKKPKVIQRAPLKKAIDYAWKVCKGTDEQECKVAWDQVEELSASAADKRLEKTDS